MAKGMSLLRCSSGVVMAWLLLFLMGCGLGEPHVPLDPPDGWARDGDRWWRTDRDSSGTFRNLETLRAMQVPGSPLHYASNVGDNGQDLTTDHLIWAVKQSLIRLYRTEPEVVDSLFEAFVTPKIKAGKRSDDLGKEVGRFKKSGYRTISRIYREPRTIKHLVPSTQDPSKNKVPLAYPDSLRQRRIGGQVRLQVYIDTDGQAQGIELLDGVHPVLDAIAMRATTQLQWQPAYLLRVGKADPIPSWTRLKVHFPVMAE